MNHVRIPGVLVVLAASLAVVGCGKKEEPKAAAPCGGACRRRSCAGAESRKY
jgi:hypothetical protein